jgi:hypothetical protein
LNQQDKLLSQFILGDIQEPDFNVRQLALRELAGSTRQRLEELQTQLPIEIQRRRWADWIDAFLSQELTSVMAENDRLALTNGLIRRATVTWDSAGACHRLRLDCEPAASLTLRGAKS